MPTTSAQAPTLSTCLPPSGWSLDPGLPTQRELPPGVTASGGTPPRLTRAGQQSSNRRSPGGHYHARLVDPKHLSAVPVAFCELPVARDRIETVGTRGGGFRVLRTWLWAVLFLTVVIATCFYLWMLIVRVAS